MISLPQNREKRRWQILCSLVIALCHLATPGRADTTSLSGATEITSLPCTISAPGVY